MRSLQVWRWCACFLVLVWGAAAAPKPKLSQTHRDFLNGPTSLLLTRDEKDAFSRLQTDEARDAFTLRFWEVRNPTPGLPENTLKEEFYRRVAYANAYYGKDAGSIGWKTDRGRAYILFGKPETSMTYNGNQELYRTELWFYPNPGLTELPAFFYVLFFEGDGVSGMRLYHPYTDDPQKLMREGGASRSQAYQYIQGISGELAHATLSLIPGEPIDPSADNGSMESMQVVNAIQGFNNMPSYVSKIRARTARLERVTTKIEYKLAQTDLLTFVVMEDGKPWVHWRLEVNDTAQKKWTEPRARLDVQSRLYSGGRLVLEQSDHPEFAVPADAEQISQRPVVYEDKIPVVDGKYQLAVELKNSETGNVYEAAQEFEVRRETAGLALGDVLIIAKHQQEARIRPFRFGGVEFTPSALHNVSSARGVSILYQVQLPAHRPEQLVAHYAVGSVSGEAKKTFEEKLDLQAVDPAGTLLVAKTLPIEEFGPGNYRLSVRVEDPAAKAVVAKAISFTIPTEQQDKQAITIARGQSDSSQGQAAVQYERALCLLAQNRPSEAARALEASCALSRNATVKTLLDHLTAQHPAPSKQ